MHAQVACPLVPCWRPSSVPRQHLPQPGRRQLQRLPSQQRVGRRRDDVPVQARLYRQRHWQLPGVHAYVDAPGRRLPHRGILATHPSRTRGSDTVRRAGGPQHALRANLPRRGRLPACVRAQRCGRGAARAASSVPNAAPGMASARGPAWQRSRCAAPAPTGTAAAYLASVPALKPVVLPGRRHPLAHMRS